MMLPVARSRLPTPVILARRALSTSARLKGVGRICQQAFVDTCSKVAFAKLYTTKAPITSTDLLNDRVLPFFEKQGLGMLRILTDGGMEYCGKMDHHDYG